MSTTSILLPSAAVAVLLAVSAGFSSSESAIFSLPDDWPGTDAAAVTVQHRTLRDLRADPHRLLVTLLVGNNLVNIAITSILTLLVSRVATPGVTVVVATLAGSVLILVVGEIVPKSYGLGHAESWSLRIARPIRYVEIALGPLVTLFDRVTRWLVAAIGGDRHIEKPYLDE